MRMVGTTSRGIRTPIIKEGDDLASIVVDSVLKASESEKRACAMVINQITKALEEIQD